MHGLGWCFVVAGLVVGVCGMLPLGAGALLALHCAGLAVCGAYLATLAVPVRGDRAPRVGGVGPVEAVVEV